MPRSVDVSIESPASVEQIHWAFSEEEYWLARVAASGGIMRLDTMTINAGGCVNVVMVQDARHEGLHKMVAKFYPREWRVVHTETWSPTGDGQVRGEISIASHGAPGSGFATALLAPTQNGSRLRCTATIEFKIPLVGGKIEGMIGRQLANGLSEVQNFTSEWITKNS